MRRRHAAAVIVLAAILAACAGPPRGAEAPRHDDPRDEAPRFAFHVEGATLADVARALSEVTRRPTVILDARVEPVASCVRLSVLAREPLTEREALEAVRLALAGSGVRLDVRPGALVFVADPDAALPPCAAAEVASAPDADPEPAAQESSFDAARGRREAITAAFERALRRVSDTEVVLARRTLDEGGVTLEAVLEQARVIPYRQDGEITGYTIYGLRRRSPLALLGFRNGDRVHTINGLALHPPEEALRTRQSLRGAATLQLAVTRRDRPMTFVVRFVDALPQ